MPKHRIPPPICPTCGEVMKEVPKLFTSEFRCLTCPLGEKRVGVKK